MIETAKFIARSARQQGWRAFVVGGFVRDMFAMRQAKDLDMEIFSEEEHCDVESVENWLCDIADNVKTVGKSFGVFDFDVFGDDVQISFPRTDSKVGIGHTKGISANISPNMSLKEASLRRDITINSMSLDPLSMEVFDFHKGIRDVYDWMLRVVDAEKFPDDALRAHRVPRLATYKPNFKTTVATLRACRKANEEFHTLPKDRLWGEWSKIAKAPYPANALTYMRESGLIEKYPILDRLYGIEQCSKHHPEGTVLKHTVNAMDKMALICNRDDVHDDERIILVLSAMLHDVGKVSVDPEDKTVNHRHERVSSELALEFLDKIGAPKRICMHVHKLVLLHMRGIGSNTASKTMVRRLARDLHPATIQQWLRVNEADKSSRYMDRHVGMSKAARVVRRHSRSLKVEVGKPDEILMGRHLIKLGLSPGKEMGELLGRAYEVQLDGGFDSLDGALEWARGEIGNDN